MKSLIVVLGALFVARAGAFAPNTAAAAARSSNPTTASGSTALHMGLLSRFRRKKEVLLDPIEIGASLPEIDVQVLSDGAIVPVSIREALGNGTSVLVGMPGAFTTTCTTTHLPGYVDHAKKLSELGVDTIAIVTTNDKFVNRAWAKEVGLELEDPEAEPHVTMLADGDAELVRELGLVEDMGFGVGIRSKRFALIANHGVVEHLEIDEGMEDCTNTSAEKLVAILTPPPSEEAVDDSEMELDGTQGAVLAGIALLFYYLAYTSGGDGGSAVASAVPVVPEIGKEAVGAGMGLLRTYL